MPQRAKELAEDIVTDLGMVEVLMSTKSATARGVRDQQLKRALKKAKQLRKMLTSSELGSLRSAMGKVDLPEDLSRLKTDIDEDIKTWKKLTGKIADADATIDRKAVVKILDDFKKELAAQRSAALKRGFSLLSTVVKTFVPLM
jgi:hypothetical protein